MAIRQREDGAPEDARSGFEFRLMRSADLDAVLRLERHCFSDPWVRESFVSELEDLPHIRWPLVALHDGQIVGYVIVWFVEDEAHVANLAVAPGLRRRGLARQLLVHALREARRRGVRWVGLEVRASNAGAIALYGSLGFRPTGVRKGYYADSREDALLMARRLGAADTSEGGD